MADGEARAARPGELYQSLELFADHFRVRIRVEKHVTPDGTQSRLACRVQRNASRARETVDEVEIPVPAHPLHEQERGLIVAAVVLLAVQEGAAADVSSVPLLTWVLGGLGAYMVIAALPWDSD